MALKPKSLCLGCMSPLNDSFKSCPHCGWEPDSVWDLQYLKPGTVLSARYIVGVYSRKNGEGATYIGYDNSLQKKVWIHEYFPVTLAQREMETGRISPLPGCGAQYKALMSDFVDVCNEVKRLGVTEPVVPIENVLSENNTVYAIYKGLDLISLEEYLQSIGAPLPHPVATDLLVPICNTLGTVHTHGHIHRGVSPYSVYVDADGKAWLWDFALGATRTAGSELDSELFTGYSAPEQYSPSGWQGSWTDVYAAGALFYRTLTGIVPPKSIRISAAQPLSPVDDLVMGLPPNISAAIMEAMQVSTEDRPQAMTTFVSNLLQSPTGATAVYDTSRVTRAGGRRNSAEDDVAPPRPRRGGTAKFVVLGLVFTAMLLVGFIGVFMTRYYPELMPSIQESESPGQESASSADPGTDSGAEEDSVTVPNFVGRMWSTIQSDRSYDDRFEFQTNEDYSNEYGEGEIYDQYPSAGTAMPEKGTVILYVSKGNKLELMPELVGLDVEQAMDILANLNVESANISIIERYSSTADPGSVLSAYPESGTEINPRTQIIVLSVMTEISVVEGREDESSTSSEDESSQQQSSSSSSSQAQEDEDYYPPIIFPTQ